MRSKASRISQSFVSEESVRQWSWPLVGTRRLAACGGLQGIPRSENHRHAGHGGDVNQQAVTDAKRLSDEREITALLNRYARAVDTKDWELYRTVFTDDAVIDYSSAGIPAGSRDEIAEMFSHAFAAIRWKRYSRIGRRSDAQFLRRSCSLSFSILHHFTMEPQSLTAPALSP